MVDFTGMPEFMSGYRLFRGQDLNRMRDILEQNITDVSVDVAELQGEVGVLQGEVTALQEATYILQNSQFDTLAQAQAAEIPLTVQCIRLASHSNLAVGGGGLYRRVGSEPSHAGKFQSADGAWWALSDNYVFPEDFGAIGDGTHDDTVAIQSAIDFVGASGTVLFGRGRNYKFTQTLNMQHDYQSWYGGGPGSTRLIFAPTQDGTAIRAFPTGSTRLEAFCAQDFTIYSDDTDYYKVALEVDAVAAGYFSNIHVNGSPIMVPGKARGWTGKGFRTFTASGESNNLIIPPGLYNVIATGDKVQVATTGVLPTGLAAGTDYWVIKDFAVAAVPDQSDDSFSVPADYYGEVATGQEVCFVTSGVMPAGLSQLVPCYVIKTGTPDVVKVASSPSNAVAGIAIPFSDNGSGTLRLCAVTWLGAIRLASSRSNAIAGFPTEVSITSGGTGVQTITTVEGASVGIVTKGWEQCLYDANWVSADKPVFIQRNWRWPSATLYQTSLDHSHFRDCFLLGGANPIMTIDNGTYLTQLKITGNSPWVCGTYGLFWVSQWSGASSFGLRLEDVRSEQSVDDTTYFAYIQQPYALNDFSLDNCLLNGSQHGMFFRNTRTVTLGNVVYQGGSGKVALDCIGTGGSTTSLLLNNCYWQTGGSAVITDLTRAWASAAVNAGAPLPRTGFYSYAGGSGNGVLLTGTGGTIDGTVIGGVTPAAGSFTTLSGSGTATITSGDFRLTTTASPTTVNVFRNQTSTNDFLLYNTTVNGLTSTGVLQEYCRMEGYIRTNTNGATEGKWLFRVADPANAGAITAKLALDATALSPNNNNGLTIGSSTNAFASGYLGTNGVLSFGNNITLTHGTNLLTFAGGSYSFNGVVNVAAATATPAGGSTAARLLFGTTAGFGIYYGSGAPTVAAGQGSLYLRSDGSTNATRLYVNTDGNTGWTNFTSAA